MSLTVKFKWLIVITVLGLVLLSLLVLFALVVWRHYSDILNYIKCIFNKVSRDEEWTILYMESNY